MTNRIIDLDAARLARAEAQQDAPVVRFNGKDYTLPNELPWSVVEAASSQEPTQIVNAVKSLLGDQWQAFGADVSVSDMTVLLENIATIYGSTAGN